MTEVTGPKGIRGWLLLPAIGVVINPILFTYQSYKDFILVADLQSESSLPRLLTSIITVEAFLNLGLVVLSLQIIYSFFRMERSAPRQFIRLYVVSLFVNLAIILLLYVALNFPPNKDQIRLVAREIISAFIWVPYFLYSKRVKNTFINEPSSFFAILWKMFQSVEEKSREHFSKLRPESSPKGSNEKADPRVTEPVNFVVTQESVVSPIPQEQKRQSFFSKPFRSHILPIGSVCAFLLLLVIVIGDRKSIVRWMKLPLGSTYVCSGVLNVEADLSIYRPEDQEKLRDILKTSPVQFVMSFHTFNIEVSGYDRFHMVDDFTLIKSGDEIEFAFGDHIPSPEDKPHYLLISYNRVLKVAHIRSVDRIFGRAEGSVSCDEVKR